MGPGSPAAPGWEGSGSGAGGWRRGSHFSREGVWQLLYPPQGPWKRTLALGGDLLGMWLGAGPSRSGRSQTGHVEG